MATSILAQTDKKNNGYTTADIANITAQVDAIAWQVKNLVTAVNPTDSNARLGEALFNEGASQNTLTEVTALVIFGATRHPIATLKITENVGRVQLATFTPLQHSDPTLPVPLIAGLSLDFWQAWGEYATALPTLGGNDPKRWAMRLSPILQNVLSQALRPSHRKLFTPVEFDYFLLKIALPVAWPAKGGVR
jgi:hypothetical protein